MTADAVGFIALAAVATAAVFYVVWSNRHRNHEWERKQDQQNLLNIQRALDRQEIANLNRHVELKKQLTEHHRILKYLARRLS